MAGQTDTARTASSEAQVKEKVNEALQQVKDSQEKIQNARRETEVEAEQIEQDQRFDRVKGALDLKEQGHNLDPTVAREEGDEDAFEKVDSGKKAQPHENGASEEKATSVPDTQMSKEERTRENAAAKEAQVPDGTISKSVRQRLLALEELRAARPQRKLISRGEPVPQPAHHYAAAAWWAVA